MKQPILRSPLGGVWGAFRNRQFVASYEARRENYARILSEQGRKYDRATTVAEIRNRLRDRGWRVQQREEGSAHVFAFVPLIGWHSDLVDELRRFGRVTHFDYIGAGYSLSQVFDFSARGGQTRARMNDAAFEMLRTAHAKEPIDFAYFYASGAELLPSLLRRIRDELGIPTVGMCLDDKNSWEGSSLGTHRAGQIDLAAEFDVAWTSARLTCDWYLAEGGRPIYLPEGFNTASFSKIERPKDLAVSFVGGAYGFRFSVMNHLRRNHVPITVFGHGWGSKGHVESAADVFRRSKIVLGMGGISYTESITNVKGRDFEVPATGGGMYLTTFNPDLAQHFVVGEEIVCYANRAEMVELIRYYLQHDEEREAIAQRGYERAWREHQWLHRFQAIGEVLGISARPEAQVASS